MRHFGVSLVVTSWIVAGSALADPQKPTAGQQQQADALFEQGRKALNEGKDPTKACELFNEAIKLDPEAAGTMLNLGLCNEQLNKYKTALYWFRKAQARASETNLPDHEAAAKKHTTDLASKVATVKIEFKGATPAAAKVKIDGEDVAPADYLRAEVDPGHHAIDAGASGYKISHQEFDVEGQGGQTLSIDLVQGDNSVIVDRGKGRRKVAVITAIGGGVLMLAAGGISLYERYGVYCPQFTSGCGGALDPSKPNAATDANHAHDVARKIATPIFSVGVAAVAVGVVLYLTAPDKERLDRTVFAPVVSPDQVGFALSGGF